MSMSSISLKEEEQFKIACKGCQKTLEYSDEERYKSDQGIITFSCQGCHKTMECAKGYYRCQDCPNDFCEDCFNA